MNDPGNPEPPREGDDEHGNAERDARRPFDTSELNTIPQATDDDPPYRSWWVVDPVSR